MNRRGFCGTVTAATTGALAALMVEWPLFAGAPVSFRDRVKAAAEAAFRDLPAYPFMLFSAPVGQPGAVCVAVSAYGRLDNDFVGCMALSAILTPGTDIDMRLRNAAENMRAAMRERETTRLWPMPRTGDTPRSSRPFDTIEWLADPDHDAEAARLLRESCIREQAREAAGPRCPHGEGAG